MAEPEAAAPAADAEAIVEGVPMEEEVKLSVLVVISKIAQIDLVSKES